MELDALRVQNYRCIDDSGWVSVDALTCFIGKNESGKTAFMRAVEKLNPDYDPGGFSPYSDYPREDWPEYDDRQGENPEVVASARFRLEPADVEAIEAEYGDVLARPEVTVHIDYENDRRWELDLASSEPDADEIGAAVLADRLPEFRYVGEYSTMNGTIAVGDLLDRQNEGALTPGDRVFLSLLSVAGLDLADFEDAEGWRERTAELEAGSAAVTEAAMRYWSQSGDIGVRIQATTTDDGDRVLDVRVENRDHNVTVEFEQRSHGFRRFFSTFCQLSELERREEDVVLLLDEPGLNLHARAKAEFLNFLKTELAPNHPIIYTTHSPFMIDQEELHRTKMVRADPVGATNVFSDISQADEHTRFPLGNVFELDLMDTLLVRPQTLLVEQKADHVYLSVVSRMLRNLGESGLDDRWTVVPIRDADNIDSFVSLFGGDELDVAALLNEEPAARRSPETVDDAADIPVKLASEYSPAGGESTIEDVFSRSFYLEIVNRAYATAIGEAAGVPDRITPGELGTTESDRPIVRRLRAYFEEHQVNDGVFDRDAPARYLQKNRGELAEVLDKETRRNFTRLFTGLDNTLESFEGIEPRGGSLLDMLRPG